MKASKLNMIMFIFIMLLGLSGIVYAGWYSSFNLPGLENRDHQDGISIGVAAPFPTKLQVTQIHFREMSNQERQNGTDTANNIYLFGNEFADTDHFEDTNSDGIYTSLYEELGLDMADVFPLGNFRPMDRRIGHQPEHEVIRDGVSVVEPFPFDSVNHRVSGWHKFTDTRLVPPGAVLNTPNYDSDTGALEADGYRRLPYYVFAFNVAWLVDFDPHSNQQFNADLIGDLAIKVQGVTIGRPQEAPNPQHSILVNLQAFDLHRSVIESTNAQFRNVPAFDQADGWIQLINFGSVGNIYHRELKINHSFTVLVRITLNVPDTEVAGLIEEIQGAVITFNASLYLTASDKTVATTPFIL